MEVTVSYLLKFGQEQHINNLYEKGEIYMNTIQTFANLDQKEIGDKFERTVEIKNFGVGNLKLISVDTGETFNFEMQSGQFTKDFQGEMGNIYSTYAISDSLLKRKSIHRVDQRMQAFGSHCILIHDVVTFFTLIENELERLGIGYLHGLVKYYNYKKNNHTVSHFHKSHQFSYQHEHRFVASNYTGLPIILNIGSLKEISNVYDAKTIIRSLTLDYGT